MEGVKCQNTRTHERAEIDIIAETEIEEEFCAIMESIKSEDVKIGENKPTLVTVDYEVQRSENSGSELIAQSNDDVSILSLRCRLCATPNNDMVDIFRAHESTEDISSMIKHSLRIVVRETDTLPKQACRFCLEKLEVCFQFQRTVAEAEKLLLAIDGQARIKRELMERNCHTRSPSSEPCRILEHGDIERTLGTVLDEEIDNNQPTTTAPEKQTADTNVQSNSILTSLKPCSVSLVLDKEIDNKQSTTTAPRKQTTATNGQRNPILTSLKPCSVTLVRTKTYCRNNPHKNEERNSITDRKRKADLHTDILNTGRASASHIDIRSLCKSSVSVRTRRGSGANKQQSPSTYCEEKSGNSGSLAAPQEAHPMKTHFKRKSGVKTFTSGGKGNRRQHDPELYECSLCKKTFNASPVLRLHKAGHSKNGDYRCSQCDKALSCEDAMKVHMVVHSDEKPWECDYCKKGFARKNLLKLHLSRCKQRTDISERHHKCNLCIKSFQSRRGLDRHCTTSHTGQRLYKCKYCRKNFLYRSERKRHHRVHTNERPYECANCPKRYKDRTGLRIHVIISHSHEKN